MTDKLLIVDDEEYGVDIIRELLGSNNYDLDYACDGETALQMLRDNADQYSAVLLDRVMPGMDGIDVLKEITATYRDIPVIFQTSLDKPEEVTEGINAGAWYYLTKPLNESMLQQVVISAVQHHQQRKTIEESTKGVDDTLNLGAEGVFHFRTPAEVDQLSSLLARTCKDHMSVGMGLMELMRNAIEHGNLGITYDEKTELLKSDKLLAEIEKRLADTKYQERVAILRFKRKNNKMTFTISDEGDGFDWSLYLEVDPNRAFDVHGRGIAMARKLAFSELEFNNKGNEVVATVDDS